MFFTRSKAMSSAVVRMASLYVLCAVIRAESMNGLADGFDPNGQTGETIRRLACQTTGTKGMDTAGDFRSTSTDAEVSTKPKPLSDAKRCASVPEAP